MKGALSLLPLIVALASGDIVREIWVTTDSCTDCGMSALGMLSVKICGQGDAAQPGGSCCVAAHLENANNNWQEGTTDIFSGPASLSECYNFGLGTLSGLNNDISMVIYHDGTDGGSFKSVRLFTLEGSFYECLFGGFMDDTSYAIGHDCVKL